MTQSGRPLRLAGRDPEITGLRSAVAELVTGRGGSILHEGEPGIGKPSLLAMVTEEACRAGCATFDGVAAELDQRFPLHVLLECLRIGRPADLGRRVADREPGLGIVGDPVFAAVESGTKANGRAPR